MTGTPLKNSRLRFMLHSHLKSNRSQVRWCDYNNGQNKRVNNVHRIETTDKIGQTKTD